MTALPISRLFALAAAGVLALTGVAACGDGQASLPPGAPHPQSSASSGATGLPAGLIQLVDETYQKAGSPSSDVPELDPDEKCPLGVDVRIAGTEAEDFGAGVSTIGDTGHRAVCDYTDPSATLSVGHFTDRSELTQVESSAGPQQEAGNEQTGSTETVGNRRFTVVRTTYPTNDSHIDYTVTFSDAAQLGYAVLQVETTDEARQTYNPAQAAKDLAAVLDSAA